MKQKIVIAFDDAEIRDDLIPKICSEAIQYAKRNQDPNWTEFHVSMKCGEFVILREKQRGLAFIEILTPQGFEQKMLAEGRC